MMKMFPFNFILKATMVYFEGFLRFEHPKKFLVLWPQVSFQIYPLKAKIKEYNKHISLHKSV